MSDRPNIVFVFCDQLRQASVGCYGQDPVVTPNLDRFAAESKVLTHCVSNQPVCTPYRGMLFTGRYPMSTGLYANCNTMRDVHLTDDTRCFSDIFSDQGYSLGYLGKLHLHKPEPPYDAGEGPRHDGSVWDAFTPPGPARHGFDFWYSYGCCDNHTDPHYWTGDTGPETRVAPKQWSVEHETDVAVEYIRNPQGQHRDPDRPFLLMVSHNPPHPPMGDVPEQFLEPFVSSDFDVLLNRPNVQVADKQREAVARQAARYYAAIFGIDQQFQRILNALDEQNLRDNTVVVFTSDHGEMLHSHGLTAKNFWYDESMLVPWMIRWPGRIEPGTDDLLFSAVDIYPTLLGLAGFELHIPAEVEGNNRAGLLLGEDGERPKSAFYLWPHWRHYTRRMFESARGVRTHQYLFVAGRNGDQEQWILHDCEADPFQMQDIAASQPRQAERLREELEGWLRQTGDPWLTGVESYI